MYIIIGGYTAASLFRVQNDTSSLKKPLQKIAKLDVKLLLATVYKYACSPKLGVCEMIKSVQFTDATLLKPFLMLYSIEQILAGLFILSPHVTLSHNYVTSGSTTGQSSLTVGYAVRWST